MPTRAPSRETARVAAIVPAFNEAATIAEVLSVLQKSNGVDEVVVVSDGSTDETVAIARQAGVRTLHLRENRGKATAMAMGVDHTEAPVLLFVDGDILDLRPAMIERLLKPVLTGRAMMSVGTRSRGFLIDSIHRRTGPLLSGIRCLRREVFAAVPERYIDGFCIETALNWACRSLGGRCATTTLHGLRHLVKEKKRGLLEGIRARVHMFLTVYRAYRRLRNEPPALRPVAAPRRLEPEMEVID